VVECQLGQDRLVVAQRLRCRPVLVAEPAHEVGDLEADRRCPGRLVLHALSLAHDPRGRSSSFDPRALLGVLDRHRVSFVLIGGLARVIEGADEVTTGVDITPSTRRENLRRLEEALGELAVGETELDPEQLTTAATPYGELQVVPMPAGTRGYDDLRRAAVREPLGQGLRPAVASKGDLARMLSALGREEDAEKLRQLRRLIELERELGLGIDL
jgi:hypothetical protein